MDPEGQEKAEGQEDTKRRKSKEERRKEKLQKMLAHMLSEENVREQLSAWQNCIDPASFVLNEFAFSGPLYGRFLERLYEHRRAIKAPIAKRSIWRCFGSPRNDAAHPSLLRLVFHGTPDQNVESILLLGMRPSKRRADRRCDWFAYEPAFSKRFTVCKETKTRGKRLLVFLVLPVKKAVLHNSNMEDVLTMKHASYQLPVGTVEFVQAPAAQT
ncbi:hypothetical protein KFL_001880235 [Klebsormidium nitens]|uniref:PARP catalytic domain-containing protein n=1 Tax=Klebsormidium nitens TaxID=105231 RepID=A0A1Y1I5J4_KLENI|nr:hypothetical protein KFL_001880235 [Klebsormidium nitens]|eukprot:GAQ84431.1 hypothetical protein KFL_001880235 [Klebsormidium nitens]